MSVEKLPHADDRSFDQVVLADPSPALVEFYAPWCSHCRRIVPIIEEVAREYAGRLRVIQVNADESRQAARRFAVQGVPTLLVFLGGKESDRIVGEVPKEVLAGHIDAALTQVAQQR